jgi:hypothetical protein
LSSRGEIAPYGVQFVRLDCQGALTTFIVHWPVACTLNESASPGVTPVISVLPDPDVAMSLARLPPKAFGSVAEIEKLVAPPMPSAEH